MYPFGYESLPYGASVHQVGWDDGAIGNHAQIIVQDGAQSILLDPTIGLIANGVTLAGLVAGTHYTPVANFSAYDPKLVSFDLAVKKALTCGLYKMRDGIYDTTSGPTGLDKGMTVGNSHSGFLDNDVFTWSGHSYGGKGDDVIYGGTSNDIIEGGQGRDVVTGNAGSDVFYYHLASDSTFNSLGRDRIMDFTHADKIDIHELRHGALSFWSAVDLNGVTLTRIAFDVTGDKVNDVAIDLVGKISLTSADFIL